MSIGRKKSEKKARLVRLGEREIETLGLSQRFWSDLYHRAMTVSWPVFFGSAASLFVALNAVFGLLYSLGQEPIANAAQNGPLAYFYFSIETAFRRRVVCCSTTLNSTTRCRSNRSCPQIERVTQEQSYG